MNVVFWSYYGGVAHTSASMLAVALATAISHKVKCSVSQLHHKGNCLIPAIINSSVGDSEVFENSGIDALIRNAHAGTITTERVRDSSFSLIEQRFNFFTETRTHDEKMYRDVVVDSIPQVFTSLNKAFKVNFIDVPAGVNAYSKMALSSADLIVVCLPQNKWLIDDFMRNTNFPQDKLVYLIGDYDETQSLTIKNLSWIYREKTKGAHWCAISHCSNYADSINLGKVISFYSRSEKSKTEDVDYKFVKYTMDASNVILKKCGINRG